MSMRCPSIQWRAAQDGPALALPGFGNINRYWDQTNETYAAKLLPGEFYVTTQDELITTVLGSCVSACIRDRVFRVGGMNHFMLGVDREGNGTWCSDEGASASTRYGVYAMERLINEILKHGGDRRNLEVKIFGGGRVLSHMTDVGRNNIEFVCRFLETEGLDVVAADVGDVYPRKVIYFPLTGRVRVKRLQVMHNTTILEREKAYLEDIRAKPVAGEVELF